MKHPAPSAILRIRCVDNRYSTPAAAHALCETLGKGAYEFTAPGASLAALDETWQAWLRRQVQRLANASITFSTIQIVDHFDAAGAHGCAAYGRDDTRARHEHNLRAAAAALAHLPELAHCDVRLYLHDLPAGAFETITTS